MSPSLDGPAQALQGTSGTTGELAGAESAATADFATAAGPAGFGPAAGRGLRCDKRHGVRRSGGLYRHC